MLSDISYERISSGIYEVFYHDKKHGTLIRQGHKWCFLLSFGRKVYWGNTRDEAVLPHFSYSAYCAYKEKQDP